MCEASCFGWIDTTVKRLDQERYIRFFCRRSKNSRWSYNTLGYARELMKTKQMSPVGIEFYKEGLRKIPHDYDVPKDPKPSKEFLRELNKNKKAKENFKIVSPSSRRTYLRWLFRAKRPETKLKRAKEIIKNLSLVKKKVHKNKKH
ncbi:MAG: YdeI/OmpD-associated family protein [Nanoarchaeota archaeon]|nr:YdeI/OmpD-associated family protein [Nanoarchaeota archaeon]